MKLFFCSTTLLLASLTTIAVAKPNIDKVTEENTPAVSEMRFRMKSAFEREFGRPLASEENESLESFTTTVATLGDRVYTQIASNSSDGDIATIFLCFGGKAAIVVKGQAAVCVTTLGEPYIFVGYGGGFSVAATIDAFGLLHKGPLGSIKGDYEGGAAGVSSAIFFKKIIETFLQTFGGEGFYLASKNNSSVLLGMGIHLGPQLDIGFLHATLR